MMSSYLSPCLISCLLRPSKETHALLRASGETITWQHKYIYYLQEEHNKGQIFIVQFGVGFVGWGGWVLIQSSLFCTVVSVIPTPTYFKSDFNARWKFCILTHTKPNLLHMLQTYI